MLTKRIIPCLDVRNGRVVKGVNFKNHTIVGDISELASKYSNEGADELVFYDITASTENRTVSKKWIKEVASIINIPFCVAGGIQTVKDAIQILELGADKISINSPALKNPDLINELVKNLGQQCVVIGIDSFWNAMNNDYYACKFTGKEDKTIITKRTVLSWAKEVESRGAGEIVINTMNSDGTKLGFDIDQINQITSDLTIPCIASGGAGNMKHFSDVFEKTQVTGALAASVFHKNIVNIKELKLFLSNQNICVRQ